MQSKTAATASQIAEILDYSWTSIRTLTSTQRMALVILDDDILSAAIALHDYRLASQEMLAWVGAMEKHLKIPLQRRTAFPKLDPLINRRSFHHAKNFVCAVRRVARIVEALPAGGRHGLFSNPETSRALRVIWRTNRQFFEPYRIARDAIEHIDGEVTITPTAWGFMNLWHDALEVVTGKQANIKQETLDRLLLIRAEIAQVVARASVPTAHEEAGPNRT